MRLQGITRQIHILAGVCAWAAGTAQADMGPNGVVFEHLNPRHTPIPGSLFDLNARHGRGAPWPTANFFGLRTTASLWKWIEPEPGHWDFRRLDQQVALAQAQHKEVLLVLGSIPNRPANRAGVPGCCKPGTPASVPASAPNLNDWRNYIKAVACRYKGRVHYYELWPNAGHQRINTVSAAQMASLSRIAYQAIKVVDPGAVVVSPGIADPAYFEKYLAAGGGADADIIGFHFVISPHAPESMLPMISIVRALMVKYGVSQKPLWNTEARWRPSLEALATGHTEDRAQAWLARAYVLSWAAGVSRLYWTAGGHPHLPPALLASRASRSAELTAGKMPKSAVDGAPDNPVDAGYKPPDDVTGLRGRAGESVLRTVKPFEGENQNARVEIIYKNAEKANKLAAQAFNNVQSWLVGARMHACAMDFNKTWACTLTRSNGHPAFILWNTAKKIAFPPPQGWDLSQRSDIAGHSQLIRGNIPVNVDWGPVMVEKLTPVQTE